MNKLKFWDLHRTIGFEFSRYVLKHPEFARKIPADALIVFQIHDHPEFNTWAKNIAKSEKLKGQKILTVNIEKLLPPLETRLVKPQLNLSAL